MVNGCKQEWKLKNVNRKASRSVVVLKGAREMQFNDKDQIPHVHSVVDVGVHLTKPSTQSRNLEGNLKSGLLAGTTNF